MREDDAKGARDREDEPLNWFDSLGNGAIAALGAGVFLMSIVVAALVNQIGGAPTGQAAPTRSELVALDAPRPVITPRTVTDNDAAWIAHAQPFDAPATTPLVALVILDDGTHSAAAMDALDWGVPVSIAVAADFDASPYHIQQITRAGAEALAILPFGYGDDLGRVPNVLRRGLSEAELRRRLDWHLARAGEGIVGVIDTGEGDMRRDTAALAVIGGALGPRGMLMVDAGAPSDTLLAARLRHEGVPVGRRAAVIRRSDSPDAMLDALIDAERTAYAWGTAIVLIEAGDAPMAAVSGWLARRGEGVALAPVSHVIGRLRVGAAR